MTCRVLCDREGNWPPRVACAACGTRPLVVFYSSREAGHHLCPACFMRLAERGTIREDEP
ncbi:hypothetical protein [Nitrospira sp. Kam-Ns4a]